jgi:hypothetical protein
MNDRFKEVRKKGSDPRISQEIGRLVTFSAPDCQVEGPNGDDVEMRVSRILERVIGISPL